MIAPGISKLFSIVSLYLHIRVRKYARDAYIVLCQTHSPPVMDAIARSIFSFLNLSIDPHVKRIAHFEIRVIVDINILQI